MESKWKKNFGLFITSQTISLFGSSLVQYAIMWYITLKTQSGSMMALSIIVGFLPTFFLSPFAGVWADRYNRKIVMVLSDLLIAGTTLIVAIIFLSGYDMIWILYMASLIRALGTAVQTPAVGAFLPQIVPEQELTKANGINGSIQSLVMLISPMLSGALLKYASIEIIFFVDVVTALLAVFILMTFLHVAPHSKALEKQKVGYFRDLQEGITYIKQHDYVKNFFRFVAGFTFLVAPVAFLSPLQVTRTFGEDVWRLTAIEITFSVGMMFGGILMASWKGFKNRVHTMSLATTAMGILTLALGVIPIFWIYLAVMVLVGVSMPIFHTPSAVLLQERVEQDFLGRVFGVMGMISSVTMPLGMLFFGPIADVIRIEWLLVVTGFLMTIMGVAMLKNKVLIEAGKPKSPDADTVNV